MKNRPLLLLAAAAALISSGLFILGVSQSSAKQTAQLVPLVYADQWGADQWDSGLREQFLRDEDNLIDMSEAEIQQRRSRGPEDWLPSSGQCDYIGKFMAVLEDYRLHDSHGQWQDLVVKRQRCYTQFQ